MYSYELQEKYQIFRSRRQRTCPASVPTLVMLFREGFPLARRPYKTDLVMQVEANMVSYIDTSTSCAQLNLVYCSNGQEGNIVHSPKLILAQVLYNKRFHAISPTMANSQPNQIKEYDVEGSYSSIGPSSIWVYFFSHSGLFPKTCENSHKPNRRTDDLETWPEFVKSTKINLNFKLGCVDPIREYLALQLV